MEVPQIPDDHEASFKPKVSTKVKSVVVCFAGMLFMMILVSSMGLPREYTLPFYVLAIIISSISMIMVCVFNIDLTYKEKRSANPMAKSALRIQLQTESLLNRHGEENIGTIGQVTGVDMKVSLDEPYCERTYERYVDDQGRTSLVQTGFKDLSGKR